jgi:hypothetical protein
MDDAQMYYEKMLEIVKDDISLEWILEDFSELEDRR